MKHVLLPQSKIARFFLPSIFSFTSIVLAIAFLSQTVAAQSQLSLADILIALRSKKASMPEKNKILSEAVKTRGITFSLTPEIEKELGNGGADKDLFESIRAKLPAAAKIETVQAAKPEPPPAPVLDSTYYHKRGAASAAKGDLDLALADFSRAVELDPNMAAAYLDRGNAYFNKKNYDQAIVDFDKTIALNPNSSPAFASRAFAYEGKGDTARAMADYQKAADLDANNTFAKNNLQRLTDEQAKAKARAAAPPPAPPSTVVVKAPETVAEAKPAGPVNIGSLKEYAQKLALPAYSTIDKQRGIKGIVVVEVTLDTEGKVIAAKAISGPPSLRGTSEDAAKRSKFKPVAVGSKIVQAVGFINYNFTQ